ncbi:MAG TPA: lamin tail domain-containing protein, partial [Verrucomicrobiota bacterium]|nr:lamin tail domain-containing protein [Verrucomicrobiota bacterium]
MRTYSAAALGLILTLTPPFVFGQPPAYGLLREVWEGIPSERLSMLTDSPDYPDRPTSTNYVTDLFEAPTDVLDNYGQRMHGYVVAPQTGNYTFWIASDDNGALYLSTDENPANARVIATVNSWTSARGWDWEANQRSEPIALIGGRIYYIAALMKEGGGGDNLAVRWLMPDGTDQAPMVATNLLPYGISFAAPVIAEHPANTSAIEGGAARFTVKTASVGVYSYQWQRNSIALIGATAAELVCDPVTLADHGARFRCVVSNKLGTATSNEGILTVSPDTTPPALVLARNIGLTQVEVTFSERVSAPSATTAANYKIDALGISSAAFGPSSNVIYLTTSPMILGATHTLTVNNVQDAAATPNAVSPNASIQFVVTDFATQDVGNPPLIGDAGYVSGGVDVRGSGDIGGTADALQFAWQKRTGAFDVRARVVRFDSTDPFAKAGLMVREDLSAGSRFVAALATPAAVGCVFMARSAPGAAASRSGYCAANYPETWLRLKRSANLFTAYAGYDGLSWVELGSAQLALPETVYFGLASASRNTAALATASFRDIGAVSQATLMTSAPRGERLGPSSRQTPLVISEIMYRPLRRPDGKTGEFIELYNADLIAADLTGHRLGGSIQFAFPDGFVLAAGGFAVIARNPVDFAAVYGIADALGPFIGGDGLPNDGGTVRLENPEGATLLEVNYESDFPWPVAADGAGHSLVLVRPSYGEDDPRAWAASDVIGGSPGQMEAVRANPLAGVLINEFLVRPDAAQRGFIELYNHSNNGADVGGCILTDDAQTARFHIAEGTVIPPRGFLAFYEDQIRFGLGGAGGRLFLVNSNATRVLDAVRYGAQERGMAMGRYPDGAPGVRRLIEPSPDNENRSQAIDVIAINEIMYNPISGDDADEFIELHNRGAQRVDLGGWRFTDGVDFQFPAGTIIEGGGYLVVAKSRLRLLASHPGLDPALVFGDYGGALANGGERVALAKPDLLVLTNAFGLPETNRILIDVDEVRYGVGGRWGQWSDGLGSSLELTDPRSDHSSPSNW